MRIVDVTPADLNAALRDPAVRAIRVAGGHRILDDLDVAAVRRDPKPIIGAGDTTFVHLELWRRCGSVGYHGSDPPGPAPIELRAPKARTDNAPSNAPANSSSHSSSPASSNASSHTPGDASSNGLGHASGTLLGGSLAAIRAMIGAGLPDLTGAILLLTGERTQGLGQVDRQLTHLRRAGILGSVAAVAVGVFTGFDGYVDRGWTLQDVLHDHLSRLTVPVLTGLPIGPGRPAVPIGTNAHLDATKRTLAIDAAVS